MKGMSLKTEAITTSLVFHSFPPLLMHLPRYIHHFPFLGDDLRLKTANRLATTDLYKGVAYVHNPKLFFIGMQDQWFTFNMFDAQAWWARDVIMGTIALPADKAALLADVDARVKKEDEGEDDYAAIRFQGGYVKELIDETDYPSFDVEGAQQAFFEWKKHKKNNIMTFRDNSYKSVMTGSMAPVCDGITFRMTMQRYAPLYNTIQYCTTLSCATRNHHTLILTQSLTQP